MAKRLSNGDGGEQAPPLNSTSRREAIETTCTKLYVLDREIERLIGEHVSELRGEKAKLKASLREDYQIPARLLQARYASYKLERAARDSGDTVTLDAIRELFDTLPVGGTVDLVDALGRGGGAEEARAAF